MRRIYQVELGFAMVIAVALLATGCGGPPPTPTSPPTLPPLTPQGPISVAPREVLNPVAGCPPDVLADWIEEADLALSDADEMLSQAAAVTDMEQMAVYLTDLEGLFGELMQLPVPECAFQVYYLAGAMGDEAIMAATEYMRYRDMNLFGARAANFRALHQEFSARIEELLPLAGEM